MKGGSLTSLFKYLVTYNGDSLESEYKYRIFTVIVYGSLVTCIETTAHDISH